MKPITIIFTSIIVSVLAAYATVKATSSSSPQQTTQEDARARVLRTGVIRCGYYIWPPLLRKDANTGKLSGIFYDLTEEAAKAAGLKVEWVEEVGLGSFISALQANRFDMYCNGVGPFATRAREADFSIPILYFPVWLFARADDARFDNNIDRINNPDIKISTLEGEATAIIARTVFPKAKPLELQQLSSPAELLQNVVDKKADVVATDMTTFLEYDKTNPGKLKRVVMKDPLSVVPLTMGFKTGDSNFRRLMDWTLLDLIHTGQAEAIYKKYNIDAKLLPRPAKDYNMGE